jgi:hypothetical protein
VAPRALLGWGTVVFGLADAVLFTYPVLLYSPGAPPALWPALVLIAVAGVPAAASMAGLMTLAQTRAPADRTGAVFGVLVSVRAATGLLGMTLAGALGDRFGIVPTLCLHAAGLVAAGLLALLLVRR